MNDQQQSRADALTAQAALAAIETFEIVGENNDSREPNAEDRFILTEFVAHLFGGPRVEQPAAAPASANETEASVGYVWISPTGHISRFTIDFDGKHDQLVQGWKVRPVKFADIRGIEAGAEGTDDLAHELWAAAQLGPGEGIEDGVRRIAAIVSRSPAMAAAAPADERAADDPLFDEWLRKERGRRCDFDANAGSWARSAWQARAAASPAAEAVQQEVIGMRWRWPSNHYLSGWTGWSASFEGSGLDPLFFEEMKERGAEVGWLYDAPQPAQADANALDHMLSAAGQKELYDRSPSEPAAQADAPAEAREPLNEALFGNDESLEMAADALDRLGEDSGAAGVRAVAYELRLLASKRFAPADAGEARLTDEQRIAIQECIDYLKPAAKDFADLAMGDSKHARCIRTLRALLNGADQ
ncbi:hypothetical protein [Burkholderia territorii]|uniref:hypothetical protein n=1 Tax=Burkholderia territorii TaxID=1503055 RepID=UPI0007527D95|nr:hypothetical protein [Burkholderia territorii]KWE25685.1 hypothetical protein WT49_02170 [Burkholderia territorii]KWE39184.1 hypothetical protein WT50_18225 [Burkholderia territorii]KWE52776.1 hypothetical protein WT51_08530 [Burkholderia territorii]